MKNNRHLFLAVATALGTSLGIAQDDRRPNPPTPSDLAPRPPGAERAAPSPDRPQRPEGDRPQERQRRADGDRPQENPRRPDGERPPEGQRRPDSARSSEGDRGMEGAHNRDAMRHVPMIPPSPPKPTSYLGVITSPVPAVVSAQLSLPEGFGLVVGEVLPDSPAAKAGIQRYDVLTKFNDQQLVDAGQFSTLVRAQAKDADAAVTLIRKAQEQKISVKVGERMMPERRPFSPMGDMPHGMEKWKGPMQENSKRIEEHMKDYGDKMREFQERMKNWQKNPSGDAPQPPAFKPRAELEINPWDILREAQPGGAAQIHLLQPNGTMTYNTASAKVLIKDEGGEMEVSMVDGKRTLVAKNADGVITFNGPIDTAEQRKALPEIIRNKLNQIEVRTNIAQFERPAGAPSGPEPEVQ